MKSNFILLLSILHHVSAEDVSPEFNSTSNRNTHSANTTITPPFTPHDDIANTTNLTDSDSGPSTNNPSTYLNNSAPNTSNITQKVQNPPHINIRCLSEEVEITWTNTSDTHSPAVGYVVEYNNASFTPNTWQRINPKPATSSCKLPVIPWSNYTFKVFKQGENEALNSSFTNCNIPAHTPYKNPENVTVRYTQRDTLEVYWKPMPRAEHNGPDFYYNISYKKNITESEWEIHRVSESESGHFTLNNLTYNKYQIKVTAGNNLGPCDRTSRIIYKYMLQGVQTFHADSFGSTAIMLDWQPPLKTNDNITGYNIYYQDVNETQLNSPPNISRIINPSQRNIKLSGLQPSTLYRITIAPRLENEEGEEYSIEHRTANSTPPIKPDFQLVTTTLQNSHQIQVSWKPCGLHKNLSDCFNLPIGSEFLVKYRIKGETLYISVLETQTDSVLLHLQPNKRYEFIVISVNHIYRTESDPQEIDTSVTSIWSICYKVFGLLVLITSFIAVIVISYVKIFLKRYRSHNYNVRERESKHRPNYSMDTESNESHSLESFSSDPYESENDDNEMPTIYTYKPNSPKK